MAIVYAAPAVAAPVPAPLWVKTRVMWEGHDGSLWDLTDYTSGVALLRDGVEGLHLPRFREWVRQSPAVPGQTFTGAIAQPRTVVLPIAIWEDSSAAWILRDRAFWKSMDPRKTGVLTIYPAGTGESRSIRLRLIPEDHMYDIDPGYDGWAAYVVTLVADQPFWEGPTIREAWGGTEGGQEFYEQIGTHLINIGSGHTTGAATLTNTGDEDAWPVWTVIGPSTVSHMGIGNDIVQLPFAVPSGKAVVVDTSPRVRTVLEYDYVPPTAVYPAQMSNPMDRTADLTGTTKFARIPGGATAEVNVSLSGAGGFIQVELTPLYWRAW